MACCGMMDLGSRTHHAMLALGYRTLNIGLPKSIVVRSNTEFDPPSRSEAVDGSARGGYTRLT